MVGRSYPSQEGHPMASPIKTRGEGFIIVLSVSFQRTHQNTSLTAERDGRASSRLEVVGASAVRRRFTHFKYSADSVCGFPWLKTRFFPRNCSTQRKVVLECFRICDKVPCNRNICDTAVDFLLIAHTKCIGRTISWGGVFQSVW